ncbi:MAG: class I SAM-dependent methyltransferase [Candidatus Acidiferrales bacterium]
MTEMVSGNVLYFRMRKRTRAPLRRLWFGIFLLSERLGVHVLPKNFYTPIQDYRWLEKNKEVWIGRAPLNGIAWNLDQQLEWLEEICGPYYHEVAGLAFFNQSGAREWGPGFGAIESQVLHCLVRNKAPARIVEIGSGQSTVCMLNASGLNVREGRSVAHITCIDPYPRKSLQGVEHITLIKQPCQAVPDTVFSQLRSGDLLFIDSSHAVKVGSDVIRIYLKIIPSLPAGVFVHIHDMNLPYLYTRSTLSAYFHTNSQETALLTALLTDNKRLSILASLSALHYDRTREMKRLLSDYEPQANIEGLCPSYPVKGHFPSSTWLLTS